jgi:hypothetical protein
MRIRQWLRASIGSSLLGIFLLTSTSGVSRAAEPLVKRDEPPKFVADLSLDAGATTYFFRRRMTTFALELAPRFGFVLADFVDLGMAFVAGWNSGTKSWSQATMFGIGPYVGVRVPITQSLRLMPWLGVLYHQTFLDGFASGPSTSTGPTATAARQIVRLDFHVDAVYRPQARMALTVGVFAKTRAGSFGPSLGSSQELATGVRLGAVSYF